MNVNSYSNSPVYISLKTDKYSDPSVIEHPDSAEWFQNFQHQMSLQNSQPKEKDLNRAVSSARQGLSSVPKTSYGNLDELFYQGYAKTKTGEHLESAIAMVEQVVSATAGGSDSGRIESLTNLGLMLHYRYKETNSLEDLEAAISTVRMAMTETPTGDFRRSIMANTLVKQLLPDFFARNEGRDKLDAIIEELAIENGWTLEMRDCFTRQGENLAKLQASKTNNDGGRLCSEIFVSDWDLLGDTNFPALGVPSDSHVEEPPQPDNEFPDNYIRVANTNDPEPKEGGVLMVRKLDSPDNLKKLPLHALKPLEGIQGRCLTLCGCCNTLTEDEKQNSTLFWQNDFHVLWNEGRFALRATPYPRRSALIHDNSLPLTPQNDILQYIQREIYAKEDLIARNPSSLPTMHVSSVSGKARYQNIPFHRSFRYLSYSEESPDSCPLCPTPDMLLPGKGTRISSLDSIQKKVASKEAPIIEILSTSIRQAIRGATLGDDYLPLMETTANDSPKMRENRRLCGICKMIDFRSLFGREEPPRSWLVAPPPGLSERQYTCSFCRFLCGAVIQHDIPIQEDGSYVPFTLAPESLVSNGKSVGDESPEKLHYTTCTIIPRAKRFAVTKEGSAMVVPSDRPVPCIQAFLVADEYNSASPLKARLPPRCVVDVSLIRRWLWFCETNHKETCGSPPWSSPSATLPEHFRVIDVQEYSVVKAPGNCRYCALSYVWGQNKTFQTTKDNIKKVAEPGGLLGVSVPLSQCVLDAINLVKAMGERYLWVDALCILQGDADEFKSQIGQMDTIYTKAVVTFVSAGGSNSKVGLPGVWPHLRVLPQVTEEVEKGIRLALPLEPGRGLPESVWNSRAWTFQEKLLSCRTLIFIDDQVMWKCRCSTWFEDIISEVESTPRGFTPINGDSSGISEYNNINEIVQYQQPRADDPMPFPIKNYSRTGARYHPAITLRESMDIGEEKLNLVTKEGDQFMRFTGHKPDLSDYPHHRVTYTLGRHFTLASKKDQMGELFNPDPTLRDVVKYDGPECVSLLSWNFHEYALVATQYMTRALTVAYDINNAFAGIRLVFERCLKFPIIYGLATSHFDAALLWMPAGQLEQRDTSRSSQTFPTWSWMGWVGNISYNVFEPSIRPNEPEIAIHPIVRWYHKDQESSEFKLLNGSGIGMVTACHPAGRLIRCWKDDQWTRNCLYSNKPSLEYDGNNDAKSCAHPRKDHLLRFWTSRAYLEIEKTSFTLQHDKFSHEADVESEEKPRSFKSPIAPDIPCHKVLDVDGNTIGYVAIHGGISNNKTSMIVVAATPGRGSSMEKYSGYAVMYIEEKEDGVSYRLGLGEIDQDAWWRAETEWSDIILG